MTRTMQLIQAGPESISAENPQHLEVWLRSIDEAENDEEPTTRRTARKAARRERRFRQLSLGLITCTQDILVDGRVREGLTYDQAFEMCKRRVETSPENAARPDDTEALLSVSSALFGGTILFLIGRAFFLWGLRRLLDYLFQSK